MIIALLVFVCAALLEIAYATYVKALTDGKAHRAAIASVFVYVISSVGFIAIVKSSLWLMLPECAGLYFGTLLALRSKA